MRIFNFSEIPNFYLEDGKTSIELENDKYIFRAYHKSGVIAYDKINKNYFVILFQEIPIAGYCL